MTNTYNGWANWETWTINMYFGDDTGYIQDLAEQNDFDTADMADAINEMVESYIDDTAGKLSGIVGEFVTAGLGEVDWFELAENWLSDCERPEEEEEEETV